MKLIPALLAGAAALTIGFGAHAQESAIRKALSFEAKDGAMTPVLDGSVLHAAIAKDLAPVEVAGRDASFKIKNGRVKVVKSKVGTGVSDDALATAVEGVLGLPPAERHVVVPLGTREPTLTTEEAKSLGVTERISSFTQYFPYAAYRVQNIGQAAKRINGTVLRPGETFSLNDTIGERTKENGYTEGFVVVASFGEFVGGLAEQFDDGRIAGEAIEALLPGAPDVDEAGLAELGERHGDAALAHGENLLEFGDGELFALQQAEQTEAAFVTEQAQGFEDARHSFY